MADERKIIYLEINAMKAVEGSSAATRALQQLEQSTSSLDKTLSRMEGALGRVGGYLKAQLAMMIGEFIGHMTEMAKASLEAAAGLDELGEQLGVSARFLQAAQYQAVQTGAKLEQLETGFSKFSQKIGEAANGSKEMIESLDRVGVKILDFEGKLRPTEDVMTDVAKAIVGIEDPAKRSAAAVDFFGKAGVRLLPLLTELANGADSLAAKAERQNAMIGDETIAKLDKVADRLEAGKLEWRAFFANNAAAAIDWLDKLDESIRPDPVAAKARGKALREGFEDFFDWIGDKLSDMVAYGAKFGAEFIESLATIPGALKNLFVRGMDNALEALESGLNKIKAGMAGTWLGRQLDIDGSAVSLGRIGGGESNADYLANRNQQITTAGQQAYDAARARYPQANDARAASRLLQGQIDMQASEAAARLGKPGVVSPGGASNPAIAGAGKAEAERIEKLKNTLSAAADAQDALTAAAMQGDLAFQEQETRAKSLSQAIEAYGGQLDKNSPKVQQLAKDIEDFNRRAIQGKAAETFAVATTQLERQNEILKAQNDLMNEAPEIQARELAIIKAKQEAEKGGLAVTAEMLVNRRGAIEQNETLKLQQDQLKKAQELWTEPLKQAFRDIQTLGSDAFAQLLDSGKFTFESLGQTFLAIIKRMAAEFLALATIRPVMSVLINAVGSTGLISQNTISQMGYGSGSGSSGGLGGGGLGNMFGGGGGLSGMWESATGGNGIGGLFQGAVPSQAGVMGPQMPGFFNAGSGLQMGSFGLGNVSGALGVGMGAMSLLNGGTKTTAGTIGGVGQMIGGGLMMIPTPWTMAAGAIISLASSVLPGLFGGKPQPINSYGTGGLNYGPGGFTTSGSTYGANAESMGTTGPLGEAGKSIQSIFDMFGGVKDASKAYGIQLASFNQQYADGSSFSNRTSSIINPDGSRKQWGMGSTDADVGLATASAEVALESILNGAVGKITDTMRKALDALNDSGGPATLDQIQATVTEVKSFDDAMAQLGKTVDPMTTALRQVDAQFQSLYDTANKYGFDTKAIDAAKSAAELKVGTDFAKTITDQLMDPTTLALTQIGDERTSQLRNNSALIGVAGYLDQTAKIEELYAKKRQQIIEQYSQAAIQTLSQAIDLASQQISGLEDLIRRLTPGGDLSNLDPTGQLQGLASTYAATRAQAQAGDQAAISRFSQDAGNYAQFAQSYYGGSTAYDAIRNQIIADAQTIEQSVGAGVQANRNGQSSTVQGVTQEQFNAFMDTMNKVLAENARLTGLLSRYVANG